MKGWFKGPLVTRMLQLFSSAHEINENNDCFWADDDKI